MDNVPKCVSFDLDGTLVLQDYAAKIRRIRHIAARHLGDDAHSFDARAALRFANHWYDHKASVTFESGGDIWSEYGRRLMELLPADLQSDLLANEYAGFLSAYNVDPSNFYVLPVVREFLARLACSGSRLFIISGNLEAAQRLKLVGLDTFFTEVFCPFGSTRKQDLFRRLLQQEALEPEDLLHVGDDPLSDGQVPAALGIGSFLVFEADERETRYEIDFVELQRTLESRFRSLAELPAFNLGED